MFSSRSRNHLLVLLLNWATLQLAIGGEPVFRADSESQSRVTQEKSPSANDSNDSNPKASDATAGNSLATPSIDKEQRSGRSVPQVQQTALQARGAADDRTSRASARAKGDLTFDDLKFDIEKGGDFDRSLLTEEIEMLHKRDVRIRGFILPASVFRLTGITEFVLVRDNMECCFGPGAALYDCVIVHMAKGKTADFSTRPVMVRGKFEIREFLYPDSDQHYAIYFMTATEVK